MDSPHLLRLGFLLLALAAPHPNIAMSGERRKGSSSENSSVVVYYCKKCKSSVCQAKPLSFEKFEKIAETPNKIFSNGIIELVTNGTQILVCFQQANSFHEGIFGVSWERDWGAALSCGNLKSGENGRGNISTEEKKICCEVETNTWERNPSLKCYTQKSGPKPTTPPADIPGNPEFLISKKNNIGILLAFLFVGVCTGWGTMYYFLRLRHGQAFRQARWAPESENFTSF